MSKDWWHYELTCQKCQAKGKISQWMDDWNRCGVDWEGFSGRIFITKLDPEMITCNACGADCPKVENISS